MKSIGIALKHDAELDNSNLEKISKVLKLPDGSDNDKGIHVDSDTEVHINIWKNYKSKQFIVDFGIMISKNYNSICLCLPFRLADTKPWEDLGEGICNNDELLRALFNKECSATCQSNQCYYKIEDLDDSGVENIFYFYILSEENINIVSQPKDKHSTRIEIKVHDLESVEINNRYYIRFRLYLKDSNEFCKSRSLSNDLIQSAFSKLDLYDIRLNEKRNLDRKDKEYIKVNNYQLAKFKKTHILYIASSKVTVENGNSSMLDSRLIEPEIWRDYEPKEFKHQLCVAHHWKNPGNVCGKEELLDSVNLFFMAEYPKIERFRVIVYLAVVILFGSLSSWVSNIQFNWQYVDMVKVTILVLCLISIIYFLIKSFRMKVVRWWEER